MRRKDWILGAGMALMIFVLMAGGCVVGGSDDLTIADTIYVNGNIYTVDDEFSKATAIAVRGGRLLYVGDTDTASRDYRGADTTVVDLEGKTVIPGIIENHLHFQSTGMMDPDITIDTNWQLKATILKNVGDKAGELGPGDDKWIYSFGWNEESPYWGLDPFTFEPLDEPPSPPTKSDLDDVAPDNPVFLERTDGHSAWLNSKALELCEITKDTPDPTTDPSTPWIVKDARGELTGIIKEAVMASARTYVPLFGTEEGKMTMYKKAEEKFLSLGLTTVVDAGIGYADVKILDDAYRDGTLKVRAYEMLSAGDEAEFIGDYGKPVKDLYGGRFSVNAVKIYADGSLGSRTAWLLEDYSDDQGNTGAGIYTSDQLKAVVKTASDYGFQVGTHAIGDRAVREVIDAYEDAVAVEKLPERRFRIEHYSVVQPDDLERVIERGIIPSIQGYFAPSDHTMAPARLGERAALAYTWRTMIDEGAKIANGSDSPVENVSPFRGIYAAVTRQTAVDTLPPNDPEGGWYPDEKITREEALRSYTSWGALAIFAEDDRGSLEAGKYADFVVIDRDYMEFEDDAELQDITVLQTYLGGELVYNRPDDSIVSDGIAGSGFSAGKRIGHPFQIRGDCPDCVRAARSARLANLVSSAKAQ
ncbi:MAG: amidohydrolase [Synergistaceae bacterium]|jgi:predicted amidohydrolase YtcJ|nr:amidohydrolase [Synergistaceae bacterium]